MAQLLNHAGTLLGILGIAVCTVSGLTRLSGAYHLLDIGALTWFSLGTALMVLGCLAKLHVLTSRA